MSDRSSIKWPRFSLFALVTIVAAVAVNLAGVRALESKHREVLPGCIATAVALQLALVRLVRGREQCRAFWAGFVVAGGVAVASLLFPQSRYWNLWYRYFVSAGEWVRYVPDLSHLVRTDRRALFVVRALIVSLPQLLLALLGGLIALFASWGSDVRRQVSTVEMVDARELRRMRASR
jgi:hypothetical protein